MRVRLQSSDQGITKKAKESDRIIHEGLFMTYKGSNKIVYVVNNNGKSEKTAIHVSFDEAHMSSTTNTQPSMSKMLQQAGYCKAPYVDETKDIPTHDILKVKKLSKKAIEPNRGSEYAAGLDF